MATRRRTIYPRIRGLEAGRPSRPCEMRSASENSMAKYLFEARYTTEGAKGVAREGGSGRRAAIVKMVEGLGGKVETFYFAFGDVDAYVIFDLPDNVTAAAVALAVNQSGGATVKTVALISPEDMDKAGKKAIDYRPPGR